MTFTDALIAVRHTPDQGARPLTWRSQPRGCRELVYWSPNLKSWICCTVAMRWGQLNVRRWELPDLDTLLLPWEVVSVNEVDAR